MRYVSSIGLLTVSRRTQMKKTGNLMWVFDLGVHSSVSWVVGVLDF